MTFNYPELQGRGSAWRERKPLGLTFHLDCGHEVTDTGTKMGTWEASQTVKKLACRFDCKADNNPNKDKEDAG